MNKVHNRILDTYTTYNTSLDKTYDTKQSTALYVHFTTPHYIHHKFTYYRTPHNITHYNTPHNVSQKLHSMYTLHLTVHTTLHSTNKYLAHRIVVSISYPDYSFRFQYLDRSFSVNATRLFVSREPFYVEYSPQTDVSIPSTRVLKSSFV